MHPPSLTSPEIFLWQRKNEFCVHRESPEMNRYEIVTVQAPFDGTGLTKTDSSQTACPICGSGLSPEYIPEYSTRSFKKK